MSQPERSGPTVTGNCGGFTECQMLFVDCFLSISGIAIGSLRDEEIDILEERGHGGRGAGISQEPDRQTGSRRSEKCFGWHQLTREFDRSTRLQFAPQFERDTGAFRFLRQKSAARSTFRR